ncbi:MAG: hypothetical protein IKX66_06380, partial [Clostridia bacterium]|nr:hypothetical protein [Clostridia bacterium]
MKTKRLLRAVAATLALATLLLLSSCKFSYEKKNLKRYVDLAREEYYGISVSVPEAKAVTDEDVDLDIEAFRLLKLRTLVSEGNTTRHARWGDDVKLYYYIAVEQENGWFLPPAEYSGFPQMTGAGFSNMTESSPCTFTVGGGVLPKPMEAEIADHAAIETKFSPTTDGTETVAATDVVYLDLLYRYTVGGQTTSGSHVGVRIDLSSTDPASDALGSVLTGLHPGDSFDCGIDGGEPIVTDRDGDGVSETLAVSGVVRSVSRGEKLAKIEADVPADFFDEVIAGRRVVMYYDMESVDEYTVGEITEETLAEEVPDFVPAGGDLVEEFRDYVRQLLENEARRKWQASIEEALWAYFDELDCIKKYPSRAIRDEVREQEKQLESLYVEYSAWAVEEYGVNPCRDVEEFGYYVYYDLDGSDYADVHEYLKKVAAPYVVRQKLIVYYIANAEGWGITAEEYEAE